MLYFSFSQRIRYLHEEELGIYFTSFVLLHVIKYSGREHTMASQFYRFYLSPASFHSELWFALFLFEI